MSRNSGNKTSVRRIEAAERVKKALELRKAGASFQAIADQLGYANARRSHEAVTRAIEKIPRQEAREVKQLELERLDRLMLAHWTRATKGDTESGRFVLDIMKRRSALEGLDAPTKQYHDFGGGFRLNWSDGEPEIGTDVSDDDGLPADSDDASASPGTKESSSE